MFASFRPKAEVQDLFKRGTDLQVSGRFKETLAFNNFTSSTQLHLRELFDKLQGVQPTIQQIFTDYLDEISPTGTHRIERNM